MFDLFRRRKDRADLEDARKELANLETHFAGLLGELHGVETLLYLTITRMKEPERSESILELKKAAGEGAGKFPPGFASGFDEKAKKHYSNSFSAVLLRMIEFVEREAAGHS